MFQNPNTEVLIMLERVHISILSIQDPTEKGPVMFSMLVQS